MEIINVPTTQGIKKETVYNIKDFPYEKLWGSKILKKKGKYGKFYYDIVATFDIETTSIEPPFHYDKKGKKKIYDYTPYGFMYHWQFCIKNMVCFGRTWEEFLYFIDKVSDTLDLSINKNLVVYVHNLSFEFQFIKDFFNIVSLFAREERKPLKFNTDNGFEFRCSYTLSNMSLTKFCENTENVIHYKLQNSFDYKKIRTPKTELTEEEKAYCFNDVMGLSECITQLLTEDTIITIPLTNTGYVRRDYRNAMQNNNCRKQFEKLRLDVEQYELCKLAFRGGNVHANRFLANKKLKNIKSMDIQSSYPFVINTEYYPVSRFMWGSFKNKNDFEQNYLKKYCVVMHVIFKDVIIKEDTVIPYIDRGHCIDIDSNCVVENGRILKAQYLSIALTEIDFDIITRTYKINDYHVIKFMYADRGKLPIELRNVLLHYYDLKTQLKGVEGKEYEYLKSKNKVNSTFGMMVTDICSPLITFDNEKQWDKQDVDKKETLEKYYNSRNSFLSYQWGIYVTAHARNKLQKMLDECGLDVVYCDTDSVKYCNHKDHDFKFEKQNETILEITKNNDTINYSEKDGKKYILGLWDFDGFYNDFKTLGSKKYCYTDEKGFHITVAGMNKKKGAERVGSVDNFNIGTTFEDVGRSTSWYNDEDIHTITVNNDTFTTASNIAIIETTYTLGVTDSYWEVLQHPTLYIDI